MLFGFVVIVLFSDRRKTEKREIGARKINGLRFRTGYTGGRSKPAPLREEPRLPPIKPTPSEPQKNPQPRQPKPLSRRLSRRLLCSLRGHTPVSCAAFPSCL